MADKYAAQSGTIPMGACRVVVNVDGTDRTIIDRTKGGCSFKYKMNSENVTTDQTGDAPADIIFTGAEASFEVPLLTSDLDILNSVMPTSTVYTDTTSGKKALLQSAQAGTSLLSYAQKVRLEPINGGEDQYVTLFMAIAQPNVDRKYDPKSQHITSVTFVGLPDPAKGNRLFAIGPEAALPTV